jgi:hypothetical protein
VVPLDDEISRLLRLPADGAGAPSLAAVETTLTDGYAEALALETERLRIERRLGEVARAAGDGESMRELAALSERLSSADGELVKLRTLLGSLQERARTLRAGSRVLRTRSPG